MGRKAVQARINLGGPLAEAFKERDTAYRERLDAEIVKWDFRQLSPGYWGFVGPCGEVFSRKAEDGAAARLIIENIESERLNG